jgi:hypothetical protein
MADLDFVAFGADAPVFLELGDERKTPELPS